MDGCLFIVVLACVLAQQRNTTVTIVCVLFVQYFSSSNFSSLAMCTEIGCEACVSVDCRKNTVTLTPCFLFYALPSILSLMSTIEVTDSLTRSQRFVVVLVVAGLLVWFTCYLLLVCSMLECSHACIPVISYKTPH